MPWGAITGLTRTIHRMRMLWKHLKIRHSHDSRASQGVTEDATIHNSQFTVRSPPLPSLRQNLPRWHSTCFPFADMSLDPLPGNLSALRECYPALAHRLDAYSDRHRVCVFPASDGGTAYGLWLNGQIRPVTDRIAPLRRIQAQLEQNSDRLKDFSRPVLVIGLYPGTELSYIFDLSEDNPDPHADQHILVCIDSLACLQGFLLSADVRRIIASKRVRLFWHEDVAHETDRIRNHPECSHLFTFVAGCPSGILNRVMPHFAELVSERRTETQRLQDENNRYYDALSDRQLAELINGPTSSPAGRAPRLLLPTCSWSTVTQYSARDTAAEFRNAGWDVRHLNMDSMLTPYYVAREIHDFRPDVFLFINHLRTEAIEAYPTNMMFVSWVQDHVPDICNPVAAQRWNAATEGRSRDLIVGYVGELQENGYRGDRLLEIPMAVSAHLFRPRTLNTAQRRQFECDLMFASNRGKPTQRVVSEDVAPALRSHGMTEEQIMLLHDHLWDRYRSGRTFTSCHELLTELRLLRDFDPSWPERTEESRNAIVQALFWRLNDTIYRHVVVEWLDEARTTGVAPLSNTRIHLYGNGWQQHPRFARYARGTLRHGRELSMAYQAARLCLHLNAVEGYGHQRLMEIAAAGGRAIVRTTATGHQTKANLSMAQQKVFSSQRPAQSLSASERRALNDWLYNVAERALRERCDLDGADIEAVIADRARRLASRTPSMPHGNGALLLFGTREELIDAVQVSSRGSRVPKSARLHSAAPQARLIKDEITRMIGGAPQTASSPRIPHLAQIASLARLCRADTASIADLEAEFLQVRCPGFKITNQFATRLLDAPSEPGNRIAATVEELLEPFDPKQLPAPQKTEYATLLARIGKNTSAMHLIEEAYKEDASLTNARARIAELLHSSAGSEGDFIDICEQDLRQGRLSPEWMLRLAECYAAEGSMQRAVDIVADAYMLSDTVTDGYTRVADRYFRQRPDHEAVCAWIARDEEAGRLSAPWLFRKAKAVASSRGIEAALPCVELAYEKQPGLSNAYSRLAWASFVTSDMAYDKVIPYFELDLARGSLVADWQLNYAQALAVLGREKAMVHAIRHAYNLWPDLVNGWARCGYARDFFFRYAPGAALDAFARDASSDRLTGPYRIYHAVIHAALGDLDSATAIVEETYREEPGLKNGHALVGWYYHVACRGTPREAFSFFELDRSLGRLDTNTGVMLAALHAHIGDRIAAQRELERTYRADPRAFGGHAAIGFCDYAHTRDTGYLQKMLNEETEANRASPPFLDHLRAGMLHRWGAPDEAAALAERASRRSALANDYAQTWLRRLGICIKTVSDQFSDSTDSKRVQTCLVQT